MSTIMSDVIKYGTEQLKMFMTKNMYGIAGNTFHPTWCCKLEANLDDIVSSRPDKAI